MHAGPGESVRRCYLWSRGEPCSKRLKCFRINSRLVIMVTSRDCACAVLCPCDELFEQLPLTFHASFALEHLSAHPPSYSRLLASSRSCLSRRVAATSASFLCTPGAELSMIFFCAWEKTNAMEYGLSLASRAFNANHTAVPLIGRTIA